MSEVEKTQRPTQDAPLEKKLDGDLPVFKPFDWTIDDVRRQIPAHLFVRSTFKSLMYLFGDMVMCLAVFAFAYHIDGWTSSLAKMPELGGAAPTVAKAANIAMWCSYWWVQGLIMTGFWVIGHECGHGGFSENQALCHTIGFILHCGMLTPYFGWKVSHHKHHMTHASMERDETWVPLTRTEMKLPPKEQESIDYSEYFQDVPLYTFGYLVLRQAIAFQMYLMFNISGNKEYPAWTNHFNPNCILFKEEQRRAVILSDSGVVVMLAVLQGIAMKVGWWTLIKYYFVPWAILCHWLVMITYLHHTDPKLPHYREASWTFARGAAATMDRDFMGWVGRFFFHEISHTHVIHHFFPKLPFYNAPEATRYLKEFIGEHYYYDDKPVFKAMWDNYVDCQFVEDDGTVIFYRDKKGRAIVRSFEEVEQN